MRGASRAAFGQARDRLTALAGDAGVAATMGDELFAVVGFLDAEPGADARGGEPGQQRRQAPGHRHGVPEHQERGLHCCLASLAGASLASGGVSSPPGHRSGAGAPYAAFGPAAAA